MGLPMFCRAPWCGWVWLIFCEASGVYLFTGVVEWDAGVSGGVEYSFPSVKRMVVSVHSFL